MEATEKVYKAFYGSGKEWLYFTEIKNITKLSNSSLQNVISKLLKSNKLEEDKKTSNIYYKISDSKKPEIYSKLDNERFSNLNLDIRIPLKNFLSNSPLEVEFILLFGSSSRKQEKESSDIDILIVLHKFKDNQLQKLYEKEIKQKIEGLRKKINSESNHPIHVVYSDLDSFKTSKDHLIVQAKITGFPIFGSWRYYIKDEQD
jgi:predicted nucleotidyltransferase